ncbi:nucleoid-associated protein [Clostridium malenominatum]|uniref:Nucleoid-associated protein n=1 Tax=Clostridium malenominatum TaxID=1539 RepID=A0ABN1J4B1_9CLOT
MQYINEVNINEAVIHILDNNAEEPILNEYKLNLSEEIYTFLLKHIEKCLKDEDLKYALFNEERNIVKEISRDYLSGQMDMIEASKEIGRQLFVLMKSNVNIPSGDLIVVSLSTEIGPLLGILKMDYIKNYTHSVNFVENKVDIDIVPELTGLPSSSQRIQKCAFIKLLSEEEDFHLYVIDKQKKKDEEEYGANYFINKFLGCTIIDNKRDLTKKFFTATEKWTRNNIKENAEEAEKIRSSVRKTLKEEENIDLHKVSEEIFGDNKEVIANYMDYVYSEGVKEKIEVDKDWVEKKYKRTRLKIDKEIDLYINEEAYNDVNKFQVQRNGDGTINIVIKNIINYIEK